MEASIKISTKSKSNIKMSSSSNKTKNEVVNDETDECTVCCTKYNKSTHLPIKCEQGACNFNACLECVRTYLLGSINEPHCMECKMGWTPKFLLILKKNWLSDIYRPHREKMLCDIEISKIAETMPDAERYKAVKAQDKITHDLQKQYAALKATLDKLYDEIHKSHRISSEIKRGVNNKEEKKEFFMPCPAIDCNGLLSTQYKCGICEKFSCHECHEVIGERKTDPHTCDPNNIASAKAIKNETKQCPGCHNRIFRIEGCSQMWCTGCHTAFDWNTGRKVVAERLHNPHWVEYQRNLNGGVAPRAPGDVPCGGLCTRNELHTGIINKLIKSIEPNLTKQIRAIHAIIENITYNTIREIRTRVQTLRDFKDIRVKYIVGEITKKELSDHIFRNDKLMQKNTELLNVYELLSAVGIDLFIRLLANQNSGEIFMTDTIEQISQYDKLRIYCNELFAVISNTYSMTVPQITQNWIAVTDKFNGKDLKIINEKAAAALAHAAETNAAETNASVAHAVLTDAAHNTSVV
jgi:hypothetical protein